MGKMDLLSGISSTPFQTVDTKPKPKPIWKAAGDLKPGDKVILKDGSTGTVTSVKPAPGLHTVYNFAVEEDHTYFVSDMGVLVHNRSDPQYSTPDSKIKEVDQNPSEKVTSSAETAAKAVDIAAGLSTLPKAENVLPGSGKTTAEIAAKIMENILEGEDAFKPDLGERKTSWFVTDGDPKTGIGGNKNVKIDVDLDIADNAKVKVYSSADLVVIRDAILEDGSRIDMDRVHAGVREKLGKDVDLNSRKAKGWIKYYSKLAAQSEMWTDIAKQVETSSSGIAHVELKNSEFSKANGKYLNGRFTVIAKQAAGTVKVRGGAMAMLKIVQKYAVPVSPETLDRVKSV
ncbi:MAG: HINT domain-containing protein, partial [Robiginitomaculum sp.]|nr:HINT domain-containing protein [Robiginitomaculum sp.]